MVPNEDYLLELCTTGTAWQVLPQHTGEGIDLLRVSARIESAGWSPRLRTRLCHLFRGEPDLTLYPSGRLLVKLADRDVAERVARTHVQEWLAGETA